MEKKEILLELEKNIKQHREVEEKRSMIMLAIYKKRIEQIKKKKIKELRKYFENQIDYYEQEIFDFQEDITAIVKKYTEQIEELVEAYNYLYINTYKSAQQAINNQIITIGSIVTLWNKKENAKEKSKEEEEWNTKLVALAQKKVNFSVIIEECNERLRWCIESAQEDIDTIFENKFFQLQIYKEGFWEKLRRKIINKFGGKKRIAREIQKYNEETLKKISDNNSTKVVAVFAIAEGIMKQIKNVEEQIEKQYKEMLEKSQILTN